MAKLYIEEFAYTAKDAGGNPTSILQAPGVASSVVTFTSATQSSAFALSTRFIRFVPDADCRIKFGANPTAVATDPFYTAKVEYIRGVAPGAKLSVYDGAS